MTAPKKQVPPPPTSSNIFSWTYKDEENIALVPRYCDANFPSHEDFWDVVDADGRKRTREMVRRYETVANRYVDNQPAPFISTAALKGPFTKASGWVNPWERPRPAEPLKTTSRISTAKVMPDSQQVSQFTTTASPAHRRAKANVTSCHLPSPESLTQAAPHQYLDQDELGRVEKWRENITTKGLDRDQFWNSTGYDTHSVPKRKVTVSTWLKTRESKRCEREVENELAVNQVKESTFVKSSANPPSSPVPVSAALPPTVKTLSPRSKKSTVAKQPQAANPPGALHSNQVHDADRSFTYTRAPQTKPQPQGSTSPRKAIHAAASHHGKGSSDVSTSAVKRNARIVARVVKHTKPVGHVRAKSVSEDELTLRPDEDIKRCRFSSFPSMPPKKDHSRRTDQNQTRKAEPSSPQSSDEAAVENAKTHESVLTKSKTQVAKGDNGKAAQKLATSQGSRRGSEMPQPTTEPQSKFDIVSMAATPSPVDVEMRNASYEESSSGLDDSNSIDSTLPEEILAVMKMNAEAASGNAHLKGQAELGCNGKKANQQSADSANETSVKDPSSLTALSQKLDAPPVLRAVPSSTIPTKRPRSQVPDEGEQSRASPAKKDSFSMRDTVKKLCSPTSWANLNKLVAGQSVTEASTAPQGASGGDAREDARDHLSAGEPIINRGQKSNGIAPGDQSPWTKGPVLHDIRDPEKATQTNPSQGTQTSVVPVEAQSPWQENDDNLLGQKRLVTSSASPRLHQMTLLPNGDSSLAHAAKQQTPTKSAHRASTPEDVSAGNFSLKSFSTFMSPPQKRRRVRRSMAGPSTPSILISTLANPWASGSKSGTRPKKRVSWAPLPDEEEDESEIEASRGSSTLSSKGDSPPPKNPIPENLVDLEDEDGRFEKHFANMRNRTRAGRRHAARERLLPTASQQAQRSPQVDAMADAFVAADGVVEQLPGRVNEDAEAEESNEVHDESHEEAGEEVSDMGQPETQSEESQDEVMDDVDEVMENLEEFLNPYDLEKSETTLGSEDPQQAKAKPSVMLDNVEVGGW